jgi:hypothetical protein
MVTTPFHVLPQEKPAAWEVYFSPHGGCTDATVRELNKAKFTVFVQAYTFASSRGILRWQNEVTRYPSRRLKGQGTLIVDA